MPTSLILDSEDTQRAENLEKTTSDIGYPLKLLEGKTQFANLAELYIGLIKESVWKVRNILTAFSVSGKCRALINNLTANNLFQPDGTNAIFKIIGDGSNVSNLCQF